MGGKGKKRREKNYKEAHGVGKNRLPPPPLRSSLDVIPSKLRKLMSYTSAVAAARSEDKNTNKTYLPHNKKEKADSVSSASKIEHEIDTLSTESENKQKKKRKRKQQVQDLRFVQAELGAVASKRKDRKKKLLEERKNKHKKVKKEEEEEDDHEHIKFGEVVQAPPKLLNVPKRFGSSSVNASQERIRLRTIEAYRDQKKWASRPGLHLPTPDLAHHNNVVLPSPP